MAWCEQKVAASLASSLAWAASLVKGWPASFSMAALKISSLFEKAGERWREVV